MSFIQHSPLRHRAAAVGNEGDRRRHEQLTGKCTQCGEREVNLLECTQHYTCKHQLWWWQEHMGRKPVCPRNADRHHTLNPTEHKQSLHLYRQMQCLRNDHEHTQVTFICWVGVFAGSQWLHTHILSHNLYEHVQCIADIQLITIALHVWVHTSKCTYAI